MLGISEIGTVAVGTVEKWPFTSHACPIKTGILQSLSLACCLNLDSIYFYTVTGTTQDFSIVQPQSSLHKWLLAPVFCHGGFAVPFGKRPFGCLTSPNPEGQTNKCRYNADENSVLACHALQVYHFKVSKPVYM